MTEVSATLNSLSPLNTSFQMPPTPDVEDPGSPPPNTPPSHPTPSDMSIAKNRVFWVSPPQLGADEKREYKTLPPGTFSEHTTDDEDGTPVKVVGDIRLGTDLYYWVAFEDGIVHRHPAKEFKNSHPALVEAYEEQIEQGTLEDFDPRSSRIHPEDRVNLKTTLLLTKVGPPGKTRFKRANLSRAAKHNNPLVISDDDDDDDDDDADSPPEYDGESEDGVDEEDQKGNMKQVRLPTRRSARAAATSKATYYRDVSDSSVKRHPKSRRHAVGEDEDDYDDLSGLEDTDAEDDEPEPKKKKVVRGRLSRPAYGNIRSVADLSDDDSDDDTAPLHAHRRKCERCQEPPAHELLAAYYRRGKKKARPRKSKVKDDFEDEEEVEEEERLLALGGWIRCLKCCVAAHWKCLGAAQRDEIIKAARSKEKEAEALGFVPRKRDSLDAYDTTEFICGSCIKGGMCMFCFETAVEVEAPPERKADAITEGPVNEHEKPESETVGASLSKTDMPSQTPPPAIVISSPTPRKTDIDHLDASSHEKQKTLTPTREIAPPPLLFRCNTCKRLAHYAHLPQPNLSEVLTSVELARYYQMENDWECPDCKSFVDPLDKILAWRPYPANAVETTRLAGDVPNHKERLPREYLVKWIGKSYRRLAWVPHMWLLATNAAKLKNFLATGPKVQLLDVPAEEVVGKEKDGLTVSDPTKDPSLSFLIAEENSRESSVLPVSSEEGGPSPALPDAERRIPPAWKTVDRVLDINLWDSSGRKRALQRYSKKKPHKRSGKRGEKLNRVDSDSDNLAELEDEDTLSAEAKAEYNAARTLGEKPSDDYLETLEEWEARTGNVLTSEHAELVIWAYVKWGDLAYEEATWDSPPSPSDISHGAFLQAFQQFLDSRDVIVRKKNKKEAKIFDTRSRGIFEQRGLALDVDPVLGQDVNLKLIDFQLTGLNWLFRNWWRHQPSILADEMGLGKTVQIACLIGHLAKTYEAFPVLIVVPNSTITNWLREFARWAPRLRIVPFCGDAKSRDVIREYELYHDSVREGYTKLKFHVLVTTYETLIGKDFSSVFKAVPRWELLVVDEGQRLKSDSSLLFRKLNELNTVHRILMTGTPLNNNIRELFNLMNFLDPIKWNNLDGLEKKYEILTEELLTELHEALKPYFLRRTKADVLKLPPKNEVIVPVSMTAIQKEVYKSILSQNMEILGTLAQPLSRVGNQMKKSRLNNLLMQLRKCLQHPYLVSRDLEPSGPELTPSDVHQNLLGASAKLRLLHSMLPKLKARGHRVLLFSQFTIALDIIEDFLVGEGHKFLRLDGNTKQTQRQKDMDTFNSPNSDIFIYLLSTRAGGVGINLWSADTVIIHDPDFNPHQDLQAISRSHRYGQTKPVLVFKLMVKGAAEERIVQTGKKKMALDHLIVQTMDDDGATDDVQSILTFGAKAIFEGSESQEINYTDADIDSLITRTETEGDDTPEASKSQSSFGFAKLWVVEKDSMEEVAEDVPAELEDDGFWGRVLARAASEKAKEKAAEVTGRGAKRRAAVSQTYKYEDDGSPIKPKPNKRRKSSGDSDIEYHASDADMGSDAGRSSPSTVDASLLTDDEQLGNAPSNPFVTPSVSNTKAEKNRLKYKETLTAIENRKRDFESVQSGDSDDERLCGLCHSTHGPGSCFMTQNPMNLVDYRSMLMTEAVEPVEMRREAVAAIDKYLASRGLSHLVKGQPASIILQDGIRRPHKKYKAQHGGSLKRLASPDATMSSSASKRAKRGNDPACDICRGPFHLVSACPLVKKGPESIMQAISRLQQDPQTTTTVNILRGFLPKSSENTNNDHVSRPDQFR